MKFDRFGHPFAAGTDMYFPVANELFETIDALNERVNQTVQL